MDALLLPGLEESVAPLDLDNPTDPKEKTKMPRGRRPKATPAPKKFERQEALKNRIVALSEELAGAGFADLLTPLVPIQPVAAEVIDEKTSARIGHVEETLAVYLQRTSIKDNLSQRPPFDHIADPIYRRLMRDFIQGAQMPEVKIAALRDLSGRIKSLDETGINYSIIDGLQRSWCYSTTVLLALHREKLVTDRCITVEAWDYFRPFVEKLGDPDTAARTLLGRTIRYEIYYNIDLEGLLHYMVTFNTAQRRMSLQVQLEIMRKPLIDEIEAAASIKVFRDTHDIETTGKIQKPRDQFAASDIAVAAEAFITNNAQASQKEVAEDLLEKDSGYTSTGVDVGDIADVVYMLKRVAQDIHPLMLLVYADEPGKKYYFSGGGTFLTGFTAACGYVRNRNNMKMLEGALEKLILLLKQPNEDPLGLEEYQELIKNITSSRGKMMRRLVYDTYLRFFLGTTTRLEWTDAYRSLSLT
jgi:hypothetical protein